MGIVEVRRHAERAGPTEAGSALSAAGRSMAERLSRSAPAYAIVAASPLPRAKETATIIAGRLDVADPALLPDLSQIVQLRTIEEYVPLAEGARERALAEEQAGAWLRLGAAADSRAASGAADALTSSRAATGRARRGVVRGRTGRGASNERLALVITHGGVIELAALRIAEGLGKDLRGNAFSYCEGVRVRYEGDQPVSLELLRV